jgi:hypothetical protein
MWFTKHNLTSEALEINSTRKMSFVSIEGVECSGKKKKKSLVSLCQNARFSFSVFHLFTCFFADNSTFFFFFLKGKLTLLLPETTIQQTHRKCEHNQPPQVCTTIIYESKRLTQLQTVTNKQIQPTE